MSDEPNPELEEVSSRDRVVPLAVLVEGGLIGLALLAGWLVDQPPLSRFARGVAGALWGVAATVPMLLGFVVMTRWPVGPLRSMKRFTEEILVPLLAPCTVIDLIGISCLAGLGEEMLFRGVLQDGLAAQLPLWAAVLIASVLFGAMHAVSAIYAVLAALVGAYLGVVYWLTGDLLAPVVAHALYDFVVLYYLLRVRQAGSAPPVDEGAS